jgi:bacillithiol biosynthesis deacetylase BshB1
MPVDLLAIGAHPDDLELSCGGTIALLVAQGRSVALADLTLGELGTRGTKDIRAKEAEEAAHILGAASRHNLEIPDGNIEPTRENLLKVISLIRAVQPSILLIPHSVERHPDHVHTHRLCQEAWFYSGLQKIETTLGGQLQNPFRPNNYFEYMQSYEFVPSFIVDISEVFETKMAAIRSYASQFHNPRNTERETKLSRPEFLEMIETRARYYGQQIGVRYGEPFFSSLPIGVRTPFDLLLNKG